MEENTEVTIKSWWRKLFCKHNWFQLGDLKLYDNNNRLPIHKYYRSMCKKCGKQHKVKMF